MGRWGRRIWSVRSVSSLSASLFIGEASLPMTPLTRVYYEVSVLATLLFGWWMWLLWVLERKLVVLFFPWFSTLKGGGGIINGACKRCHLVQTNMTLENKQIRSGVALMRRANWKHGGEGHWKGNSLTFSIHFSQTHLNRGDEVTWLAEWEETTGRWTQAVLCSQSTANVKSKCQLKITSSSERCTLKGLTFFFFWHAKVYLTRQRTNMTACDVSRLNTRTHVRIMLKMWSIRL